MALVVIDGRKSIATYGEKEVSPQTPLKKEPFKYKNTKNRGANSEEAKETKTQVLNSKRGAGRVRVGSDSRRAVIKAKAVVESLLSAKALALHEREQVARVVAKATDDDHREDALTNAERTMADRPHVQQVLVEALAKVGVTVDKIASTMAQGLNATTKKYFADKGIIVDEREDTDHYARHKFLITTLSALGVAAKTTLGVTANFTYKSHLRGKEEAIDVTPPKTEQIKRRMQSQKAFNRSHA